MTLADDFGLFTSADDFGLFMPANDFGLFIPAEDDFGVLQSRFDSFSMDFTKDEKVTKPA